jgi:hypothetical protein
MNYTELQVTTNFSFLPGVMDFLPEPKNRVTIAEATVVQQIIKAPSRNRAVFRLRGLFLVLFWTSKKE